MIDFIIKNLNYISERILAFLNPLGSQDAMAVRLSRHADYATLVENYDTFLFDCDGTLWNGSTLIGGVIEALDMLRNKGKKLIFVTNDSRKSRRDIKARFDKLGIRVEMDEIYGAAYASAVYISAVLKLPTSSKVYVIGMEGLEEELKNEGLEFLGGTTPEDNTLLPFNPSSFIKDPDVKVVLSGGDTSINYTKLCKAFQYLQDGDEKCKFLATGSDAAGPTDAGIMVLAGGSLCATLIYASKREPLWIGKPESTMLDCIRAKHAFDPARTIVVGDNLDTDIAFGRNGGISTLLVMTGVTTEKMLVNLTSRPVVPNYIIRSFGDLQVLL